MFLHEQDYEDSCTNAFSVSTEGRMKSTLKSRAIVRYSGPDDGSLRLHCTKDPTDAKCDHIARSRNRLQQVIQNDINATDEGSEGDRVPFQGESALHAI